MYNIYYIYIYAFSRRFYPKRLTIAFRLYIFISILYIVYYIYISILV